jgi:hypothetical protein
MEPVTFFVFASPEKFTPEQEKELLNSVNEFLKNWKSHGVPVRAKTNIEYGHFLTVEILPGSEIPGGCSKDELFRKIMNIEKEFNLSLLDRKYVYFWDVKKQIILPIQLSEAKNFLSLKTQIYNLKIFDTIVTNKAGWSSNPFEIKESWLTELVKDKVYTKI